MILSGNIYLYFSVTKNGWWLQVAVVKAVEKSYEEPNASEEKEIAARKWGDYNTVVIFLW